MKEIKGSMSHLMDECDALLRVPHAYALRLLVYKEPARKRIGKKYSLNFIRFKTIILYFRAWTHVSTCYFRANGPCSSPVLTVFFILLSFVFCLFSFFLNFSYIFVTKFNNKNLKKV